MQRENPSLTDTIPYHTNEASTPAHMLCVARPQDWRFNPQQRVGMAPIAVKGSSFSVEEGDGSRLTSVVPVDGRDADACCGVARQGKARQDKAR